MSEEQTEFEDLNKDPGENLEFAQDIEEEIVEVEEAAQEVSSEIEELKERIRRLSADYQNYAARAAQETERARKLQLMDVTRALIGVLDNFDQALQVDPENVDGKSLLQGVEMVQTSLVGTLNQFGIKKVEVKAGDEFNPACHEALMKQPSSELAPGLIALQIQPGYMLDDNVVRPAKVAVTEEMPDAVQAQEGD